MLWKYVECVSRQAVVPQKLWISIPLMDRQYFEIGFHRELKPFLHLARDLSKHILLEAIQYIKVSNIKRSSITAYSL